jgi:hypothetical protein
MAGNLLGLIYPSCALEVINGMAHGAWRMAHGKDSQQCPFAMMPNAHVLT